MAHVGSRVRRALVKTDPGNGAIHIRAELHPQFHGARVGIRQDGGSRRVGPDARARRRGFSPHRHRDARRRNFQIPAVVRCPCQQRCRSRCRGRPRIGPVPTPARRHVKPPSTETSTVPTQPPASLAVPETMTGRARRQGRPGRGNVITNGGFVTSEEGRRRDEVGLERGRLDAHVGEEVHGGLSHRDVGRRRSTVVDPVESPGPLNRTGAEHERSARVAIEGQGVGRDAGSEGRTLVQQVLAGYVQSRSSMRAEPRPAGRNPLSRSSSHSYPRVPVGRSAVCPAGSEATAVFRQNRRRLWVGGTSIRIDPVHHEDGTGQGVLRLSPVGGWAQPWVAPGPGPDGVDRGGVALVHVPETGAGRPECAWVSL